MRALAGSPVRLVALAAALALGGCGKSPKTTILTLDMAPPERPSAAATDYRGLPIAVPAVRLPAAIDRAEFVRETAPGTLAVDDFARWSAPLGALARDALVRDLAQRVPAGSVLPPGATATPGRATAYDVTILSIDTGGGGGAMQAAFRRLPGGPTRIVSYAAPAAGPTPPAQASTLSTLLGRLADDIAADAASTPPR